MPALEALQAQRIVATAEALDAVAWPAATLPLRTAPDEVLLIGVGDVAPDDPHAIVMPDGGWVGTWLPAPVAYPLLRRTASWPIPDERPGFAQGLIAGLPVKLWLEDDRVLFVLPAAFGADFEERSS